VTLTRPERGAIIRYAYLWADEHAQGREEGRKDRPVLVLALAVKDVDGTIEMLVVAVTHSPPRQATDAVPLSAEIKRQLGLDNEPSWIVTTEANAFVWPGPDIRPIPGRSPPTIIYGRVPDGVLRDVARSYLANRDRQRSRRVDRM